MVVSWGVGARGRWATYENDLEEHLLVDLHKLLVPLLDLGGLLVAGVGLVILGLGGVVAVVLAPLDDLSENSLVHLEHGR